MAPDDARDLIGPAVRDFVRLKAERLAGREGLAKQDVEDLCQELLLDLLERLPSFDPGKASIEAFAGVVAAHAVSDHLRHRRARRRDYRLRSLCDTARLDQLTEGSARAGLRGGCRRSPEELANLALDLAEFLAGLPPHLRDLAERLKSATVAEIARETGVPRSTVSDAVRRLRRLFEEAGFRNYL